MGDTIIPAASLSRVLEGAAVATKAPDGYVEPLSEWLRQFNVVSGSDSPLGVAASDDKHHTTVALSFSVWRNIIEARPEYKVKGIKQLAQVVLAVSLLRERSRGGLGLDSATIDTIWSLIYEAIIGSQHSDLQFTVSRSAQGFLAVPLCSLINHGRIDELWRFHTWMPDGQRGIDEKVSIHAHQPFGESWTLLGCGTDCTFEVDTPDDLSLATHAAYECSYASTDGKKNGSGYQTHQMSSTARSSGRLLRVAKGDVFRHSRDMTYSVPAGAYHRSIVPGRRLHATLFVFDSYRGYNDDAAVLGPKEGGEYVQLRDPAGVTPIALAQMADATRKWEQTHGLTSHGEEEHPTIMAYYRIFRAIALLEAGRREDAVQYLNPGDEFSPVQILEQDASPAHQYYLRQLVDAVGDTPLGARPDYGGQKLATENETINDTG